MADPLVRRLRAAGCVYAEEEARLLVAAAGTGAELERLVARRVGGEPLEHVLGWAEFAGVRVLVRRGVFVPRRRTELLVAQAVARGRPGGCVVDLCTGSGAVALLLARRLHPARLHAVDVDAAAVACARANLAAHPECSVHQGDLFRPLPRELLGRVDLLTVNAPYVPTGELALLPGEAREHEPARALDGGGDGLAVARRVLAQASGWLAPRGVLVIETSAGQSERLRAAVRQAGLAAEVVRDAGLAATVVLGVAQPAR